MKLSEIKEIAEHAMVMFDADCEVRIYGEDGAEFEPEGFVRELESGVAVFD